MQIELAGMGTKRIRIANLPPEEHDSVIQSALAKYAEVKDIKEESWSRAYRDPVSNGIRIAVVALKHHIPSMSLVGNRVLIYEGQPLAYYGYNESGHQYQACPHRRKTGCKAPPAPTAL